MVAAVVAGCGWLAEAVAVADFVPIVRVLDADVDVGGELTWGDGDREGVGPGEGGFEAAL